MSGTNSLFQPNPFGQWQNQPQNALAPVNDASAVNSIYNVNTASPQGTFYGEPGFQYPQTIQPQMAAPVAAPQTPAAPAAPVPGQPGSPGYPDYAALVQQMQTGYGAAPTQGYNQASIMQGLAATLGSRQPQAPGTGSAPSAGTSGYDATGGLPGGWILLDGMIPAKLPGGAFQALDPRQQPSGGTQPWGYPWNSNDGGTGGGTSGGGSGGHGQDASGQWG